MTAIVEVAMHAPGTNWRIEIVRLRGQRNRWYRIRHHGECRDRPSLTEVEEVLA